MISDRMTQYPPTMELNGVRLRALRSSDVGDLYAYLSNPVVTELTSYPEATAALAALIIEKSQKRWESGELGKWGLALTDTDVIIGICGFNESSPAHRWAEIAYELAPTFWGKGLISQAVTAVLRWTFEQDLIDRVQAYVRVDNLRSQRVLERHGFSREGCLRHFRICRGQPFDFSIYALLRPEWEAMQKANGEQIAPT